tara:strand:+ start:133 stop:321 length:189 start_codon:yes stop_codon:yes gene_type:complete
MVDHKVDSAKQQKERGEWFTRLERQLAKDWRKFNKKMGKKPRVENEEYKILEKRDSFITSIK